MKKVITFFVCLVMLNLFVFSNQTNPTNSEPKYYENAKVIRVKYTSGEAFVQRSYDEGFEQATINLPIFEKDKAGTTSGRLEFYLGRSNYLRLDYDTEVIFSEIPALRKTNANIRIIKGGVYLDIDSLDTEKDIEIQAPDCGIFLLDRGIYRINVNEAGFTEVYVFEGMAEVAGDNYSRNVRANQKTIMANGNVRERPFYFQTSDRDGFDEWNEQRNRTTGYSRHSASRYLESGYEDYEYELSQSGRWTYEPTYTTYIWIPYNIGSYWRPYWHGRWIWHPFYGHVWNSYDPWGWYTHYYGRWHWSHYHGWHWMPGYHWSPAWVSWFWNNSYYGWCPLSYWNKPLIILNKKWLRNYNYRKGIPLHSRSNIIIKKNQLSSAHIHKVALKRGSISSMSTKTLSYRGAAPRNQLNHTKMNMIDARGRTVQYKKGGIFSAGKSGFNKTSTSKSQQRIYKYSSKRNTSEKPFKTSRNTTKSRVPYRKQSIKSYRSQRSSPTSSSYRSYKSPRKSSGQTTKSYRKYTPSSQKRSSSGKSKTKRKKDQPYFSSRTTRSSQSRNNTSSSTKYYSSPAARNNSTSYRSRRPSSHKSYRPSAKTYSTPRYRSQSQSSNRSYRSSYHSSYKSVNRSNTSSRSSYSRSTRRPTSTSRSRSSYSRQRSSSSRSYSRSRSSSRSSSSRSSSSRSSSSRSSSSSGRRKH